MRAITYHNRSFSPNASRPGENIRLRELEEALERRDLNRKERRALERLTAPKVVRP